MRASVKKAELDMTFLEWIKVVAVSLLTSIAITAAAVAIWWFAK